MESPGYEKSTLTLRTIGESGLIVDSVENIVHVYAGDKLPVPSIMIDASQKTLRGDLKEIVEVPQSAAAKDGPTMAMMIFDIAQLTGRIAQLLDD